MCSNFFMQPFSAADDPPLSSMSKETAVDMEEVRLKVEMCNSCGTCTSTCSTSKEVLHMKLKMLCTCTTAVLCDYYVAQFVCKFARKKHCQMFPALATVCCTYVKGSLLLIFILSRILFATLYSLNPMVPSLLKEGTEGDTGKKKTHIHK